MNVLCTDKTGTLTQDRIILKRHLDIMQKLGLQHNFWFGHQGWEYADIGRFWQWFLFIGLMLWLVLVGRALWPAIRRGGETKSIVSLLFLSTMHTAESIGAREGRTPQ